MNRIVMLALLVLAVPAAPAQDTAGSADLDSDFQKFSYAMGFRMGRDLLQQGVRKLDSAALAIGVKEAISGADFRFTQEEIKAVMTAYQEALVEERTGEALANKDKGDAFMKVNAEKEGVQSMDNGLQYKILSAGTGDKPAGDAKVKVHYTGTLIDGTEFDSSRARGEPTELTLDAVIPGWQQALTQMPVGSRWMVWIPPEQGYGLRGAGASIGPNETLIFDIELIEVVEAQ